MADQPLAPIGDDLRHDDLEYDPSIEPRSAKAWLNLLEESEEAFETWNTHCDRIDKQLASIERLADMARDKQFQMFWANAEVLKPSIYATPPVPVVVPKFRDRRPVYTEASELLERCCVVTFDIAYIDELMRQVRDDLAITNRGVAWCRYESGGEGSYYDHEKICIDWKDRRDFLHSISRCWAEVTWVAAASYLTRSEARARFYKSSGDAYQSAEYEVDRDTKDVGGADNRERAKFWEIWNKNDRRVVWVAKGVEDILDEADPHLDLAGFFPCPKPAYGTCQRRSLVPVPDVLQYKDQLEELNLLTGRIHALSNALEVRGFYPSGSAELSEAVEAAVKTSTPGRVLVPISNWAAFGGTKEVIIWLPIDVIAQTISALIELRKQIVDDIYQIMGLSDIMRGATDPRETYGAQSLKSQYGSTRIRDKQYELVRLARDLVCICADILCQKFKPATLIEMSQSQLPTKAMQQQAVAMLTQQVQGQSQYFAQMRNSPQAQQLMQSNPDQANQLAQQAQMQIQNGQEAIRKIAERPNIEQVLTFLRDNRARAFVLDIETDSTILVDEKAEKESRTEFVTMLAQLLPQLTQFVAAQPASVDFCGEVLKFSAATFRAGRSLDGAIDDLVQTTKAQADGPKPDDPTTATNKTAVQIEQMKQQRQSERDKADVALKQQELQMRDQNDKLQIASKERVEMMKLRGRQGEDTAKMAQANQKAMHDRESHQADMLGKAADFKLNEQEMAMRQADHIAKQNDMAQRHAERLDTMRLRQLQQSGRGTPL